MVTQLTRSNIEDKIYRTSRSSSAASSPNTSHRSSTTLGHSGASSPKDSSAPLENVLQSPIRNGNINKPTLELILVSNSDIAVYSGMIPGVLAQLLDQHEAVIDLVKACQTLQWTFVKAEVVGIDADAQVIVAKPSKEEASRNASPVSLPPSTSKSKILIPYDILSVNIGSTTLLPDPSFKNVLKTRPIWTLPERLGALEQEQQTKGLESKVRVAVIGAGMAGIELAFALHHRLNKTMPRGAKIVLIEKEQSPTSSIRKNSRLAHFINVECIRCGIDRIQGARAIKLEDGNVVVLDDGKSIKFDDVLLASGASPPPWLTSKSTNLALSKDGFFLANQFLQSVSHPNVFFAGDCVSFEDSIFPKFQGRSLPKAGVYSVREAPILASNLLKMIEFAAHRAQAAVAIDDDCDGMALDASNWASVKLQAFNPQAEFLALLSLGDGRALGCKWDLAFRGRWVWNLKLYIDRSFMEQFHKLDTNLASFELPKDLETFKGTPSEGAGLLINCPEDQECFEQQWQVLNRMHIDNAFLRQILQVCDCRQSGESDERYS
eukprot:CAMPEP_0184692684 /NCGR_PEP_ID=MMETSP0313-20130426/1057_1 /TAXON_ID=2792 /ORGANISM="Porphyridium aerugineum, Strain SAG 1380-2" /LENGTH=548 /DNA_ID=CAMNT_0027150533 /DNA_START=248 /DNA_END=1894 /DNA_ORIENTATION=+